SRAGQSLDRAGWKMRPPSRRSRAAREGPAEDRRITCDCLSPERHRASKIVSAHSRAEPLHLGADAQWLPPHRLAGGKEFADPVVPDRLDMPGHRLRRARRGIRNVLADFPAIQPAAAVRVT